MRDRRPFWEKVAKGKPNECWPWTGYKKSSGHGLTQHRHTPMHASRKAWILTHGEIRDERECVNHTCDNPACCNPAHLYLGTRADNMIDRFGNVKAEYRKATGRTRILTDEQLVELWEMRRARVPLTECAKKFGVHIGTICRYLTPALKQKLENLRADRLGEPRTN